MTKVCRELINVIQNSQGGLKQKGVKQAQRAWDQTGEIRIESQYRAIGD